MGVCIPLHGNSFQMLLISSNWFGMFRLNSDTLITDSAEIIYNPMLKF